MQTKRGKLYACANSPLVVGESLAIKENVNPSDPLLIQYLTEKLPFTVNIIAALRDYPSRSKAHTASLGGHITGCLVEFNSTYNKHIWTDPIIWITGNEECSYSLLERRGFSPAVIISESPLAVDSSSTSHNVSTFAEYIMTLELSGKRKEKPTSTHPEIIRKMGVEDINDSLVISGMKDLVFDPSIKEHEGNFLSERTCLGLYTGNGLASRGAVMSTTPEYASVGAFVTTENERRRGYGSCIVKYILIEASRYSRRACLFVRSTNSTAISLYRKLGFEIHSTAFFTDLGTGSSP